MSPNRTTRAVRHHPVLSIFLALVVVIGGPVSAVLWGQHNTDVKLHDKQQQIEAFNRRFVDYQVLSKVQGCQSANGSRKALQTVLDRAANPPAAGAATVDFSRIKGFNRLDLGTQFFLNNLEAVLAQPAHSVNLQSIADDYRSKYPHNLNCSKIGAELRHKLEGHHA